MEGGVLVGERACNGALCEGQCTKPVLSGAPEPSFYWDAFLAQIQVNFCVAC